MQNYLHVVMWERVENSLKSTLYIRLSGGFPGNLTTLKEEHAILKTLSKSMFRQ